MAKGAATEETLGKVHKQLARVFNRVLEKYEMQLRAIENIKPEEIEQDMLEELMKTDPNPAMLSAISKFLKDNEIGIDNEEVQELGLTQRRLRDRREARKKAGLRLVDIPPVQEA